MLELHTDQTDAPEFLDRVHAVVECLAKEEQVGDVILVHVDNFFDTKWHEFAGEVLGAVGVWKSDEDLAIPPFVPGRILSQRTFSCATGRPILMPADPPLHISIRSEEATRRRVQDIAPDKTLVWYSSRSRSNGMGSIMAYVAQANGSHDTWHAVLQLKGDTWIVPRTKGIAREAIEELTAC